MPQNSPQAGWSVLDYSGETSNFAGYIEQPTAVNLPTILTDQGTMRAAIQDIILGTITVERGQYTNTKLGGTAPTDANAQRERKWLVKAVDTLEFLDDPVNAIQNPNFGLPVTMEIPTARFTDPTDVSMLLEGTDIADPGHPLIAAFVSEFEGFFRSRAIGILEVQEIVAVGRNN